MNYLLPFVFAALTVSSLAQSSEQQSEQSKPLVVRSHPKEVGLAPVDVGKRYYITLETAQTTGNSAVFSGTIVEILGHGDGPWYRVRRNEASEPIWVNFNFVSTIQPQE